MWARVDSSDPAESVVGMFLPFMALQHHGSYRGYRRHVADGAGRPSLTHTGLVARWDSRNGTYGILRRIARITPP